MTIKKKVLIIEALVVLVLASIKGTMNVEKGEAITLNNLFGSIKKVEAEVIDEVVEVEPEEHIASISDHIIHFETIFTEVNEKGWIVQTASLKAHPYPYSSVVGKLVKYNTVTITGYNEYGTVRVVYNGKTYYMSSEDVTTDIEVYRACIESTYNANWRYRCLTPVRGTIQGPSGKETYYNLDMSGVIAIMRRMGNNDIYWIREDGVKMLGDYVMIAAELNIRPRGSLVETSLGMGIVCDTGGFALRDPYQIDIAVDW